LKSSRALKCSEIVSIEGKRRSTMDKDPLSSLEKVNLRTYWKDEALNFTPWLADQIHLLGKAIGFELEVEAQEKEVGPFSADILCKDTVTGNWVLIENQLERTDHIHLGQLLTYAAGLDAVTIVWVADKFREEHRAALDWLNQITDEKFDFFGIEMELWKIGDSPMAPKFNVVCRPNDWSQSVQRSAHRIGELSETRQMQLSYWTAYKKYMEENSDISCKNPNPQNWIGHPIGRSGFWLSSVASTWDSDTNSSTAVLRVELVIDSSSDAKMFFGQLKAQREEIEKEIGESLTWHNPAETRMCRIWIRKPADIMNRDDWPQQHAWLKEKLELFHRIFSPRVKNLRVDVD